MGGFCQNWGKTGEKEKKGGGKEQQQSCLKLVNIGKLIKIIKRKK